MLYNSERIENVGLIAVPEKQFQSCFSKKMTDIATCLEIVLVWQESKATCMKITKCNRYILTHPELLHQILSNRKKEEEEAIKEKCYSKMKSCKLKSPRFLGRLILAFCSAFYSRKKKWGDKFGWLAVVV